MGYPHVSQESLFEHVRVDGRIPTRVEHLVFLETETCRRLLGRLDAAWPMPVLKTATLRDRGAAHRAARTLLGRILEYGERLSATDNTLRRSGLSVPYWAASDEVAHLLEAFAAVEAELAWQQTGCPWLTSPTGSTPGVVIAGQPATCANWRSVRERLSRRMETSHSRALAEGFLGRACRVRSRGAWARMR